jgi:hypothetical protein
MRFLCLPAGTFGCAVPHRVSNNNPEGIDYQEALSGYATLNPTYKFFDAARREEAISWTCKFLTRSGK